MEHCENHDEIISIIHDKIDETGKRLNNWFWKVTSVFGSALITAVVVGALKLGACAEESQANKNTENIRVLIEITKTQSRDLDKSIKANEAATARVVKAVECIGEKLEDHISRDWEDHGKGGRTQ